MHRTYTKCMHMVLSHHLRSRAFGQSLGSYLLLVPSLHQLRKAKYDRFGLWPDIELICDRFRFSIFSKCVGSEFSIVTYSAFSSISSGVIGAGHLTPPPPLHSKSCVAEYPSSWQVKIKQTDSETWKLSFCNLKDVVLRSLWFFF